MDAAHFTITVDHFIDDLNHPASTAQDAAPSALRTLIDHPGSTYDEPDVLAALVAAVRLRNVADYLVAGLTAATEVLAIPTRKHLRSGSDLLTGIGMAPAAAHRAARVGRTLGSLPTVERDLRDGHTGAEMADAIGRGLHHVETRADLDDEARAAVVLALRVQTTPAEVATRAREIAIDLTPAPEDDAPLPVPVAEDASLNSVTVHQNDEGRISGMFDLDVVTGEELTAALDPLCRPVPQPDGSPDPRTTDQRRADAFGQLIRTYLAGSERPTSGGVLPHVTLIRPAAVGGGTGSLGSAGGTSSGDLSGGGGGGVDQLGFGGAISTFTADLISCDATLAGVYVDAEGAPLDVGRSHRRLPPKLRQAPAVRDRGCAFPGCGRPASWCDCHHMTSWAEGGATSVDNGVMLCRRHHVMVHHDGWQVFLGHDRHPWFLPPADPAHPLRRREALRSHGRRTLNTMPMAC